MRTRNSNGSKLFLTELMLSIFLFSVITAVCVQLFAESYTMSRRSENLTQAVNAAANVAECYNVWDLEQESWSAFFPHGSWNGETWQLFYDETWQPCEENGQYLLEMKLVKEDVFLKAHITVTDNQGDELYSLMTKRIDRE